MNNIYFILYKFIIILVNISKHEIIEYLKYIYIYFFLRTSLVILISDTW